MAYDEHGNRTTEGSEYGFIGYTVYDRDYEKIGKVDDLFVDENDQPEYIGVKMGFLGTKSTLIPIELVRINDKRKLVEVEADKETIKDGPTFAEDREITAEFERRVLSYYQVETSGASSAERGAYGAYYYSDAAGNELVDVQPGERAEARRRSSEERLGAARGNMDSERSSDLKGEDELRMQRVEEELRAGTRERAAGSINVRKRVRTDRERLTVPKKRQEVRVDRVSAEGREDSEAELGEDEVRVPVIEEEVVVEKRPVVKEELRIRKKVVEDEEVIEADVRKEEVEIDDQTKRRNR